MSLFPSTLTGRILDDGVTAPPVIELQGISAGQLATVLTAYTPLTESAQHTADIGTNAAAIAALQGQVAALPAAPDLTPYALASDLAAAEGPIAANASGLTAVNTSLTLGLASKANQSALDALQIQVDGKSTPASVDLKLAKHPTTAAMNSSIASTNNATLATVAATYALKGVVDQLAIDVAARQTAADVDQRVGTALLSYLTQTAYQAGQALQDARLDGHDAEILALQNAGPFTTAGDLNTLQLTLQSAIDGILAEIATLGGATNLVNAPAWVGNVTWDLLAGTNQIRNLHATGPLSIQLANDDWTLSFGCDAYSTQQTDDAISTALSDYFTRTEVTLTVVAAIDESKGYTDTQLADYSTTTQMTQAITDALVPFETAAQRDAAISLALQTYYTSAQTDSAIAAGLVPYSTTVQMNQAIAAAALSNGQSWTGGPTFNLLRGSNVLRNLSVAGALTASFQNLDDTILIESDSYARGQTFTQAETGAAITAAIDALDLSQFQNEAEVQALIAAALVPYWDQTEVSTYVAGELANYATSSSVTSAISSALSSYDNSSQVDSKIITALLDFYTQTEVDQQITNALGNVDLSNYFTQAETQSYVASELLAFYPRTELDSQLTATFTQYWTSSSDPDGDRRRHRRRGLPHPSAGRRALLPGQRQRELRVPGAHQRHAAPNEGPPAPGAPGGQHHPLGHHARADVRCLYQIGGGWAVLEQQQLRAARRKVLCSEPCGPGPVHCSRPSSSAACSSGRPSPQGRSWATAASSRSRRTAGARPRATGATPWWPPSTPSEARSRPSTAGSPPWRTPLAWPPRRTSPSTRSPPRASSRRPCCRAPRRTCRSGTPPRPFAPKTARWWPASPPAASGWSRTSPSGRTGRSTPPRPVLRGLHGGHRGLHEQQLHHRHAADRERPAGPGAAAALRSGGQRADRHRRDPGRAGGRHPARERGDSSGSEPALPEPDGGAAAACRC